MRYMVTQKYLCRVQGEAENAGRIGLTLVASGVGGSIVAGVWLDRTKYYKYVALSVCLSVCLSQFVN